MPGAFFVKQIKSKRFTPGVVANEIRNAIRSERRLLKKDFEDVLQHWQGERPNISVTTQVAPTQSADIVLFVGPTGPELGVKKFLWLDHGTKVRYYAMDDEFVSKTHPNSLDTNPGEQGTPFWMYGMELSGIEPRNWSELIRKKREKGFKKKIFQAFQRGLAKSTK